MSVVLVTGTDTGIGKTLVGTAIAAALTRAGRRVAVMKPVETGCRPDPEDALALAAAAGDPSPLDDVCPYRFPDPLAPLVAAERVGAAIAVDRIVADVRRRATGVDVLLIEGAGGILVPLTATASFADLAAALGAAVLVVVGSRLGGINHALLTLEVLAARGIPTAGYVVNRLASDGDPAVATNEALLARLTPVRCLGVVPWLADGATLLGALRGSDAGARAAARARLAELGAELDLARLAI